MRAFFQAVLSCAVADSLTLFVRYHERVPTCALSMMCFEMLNPVPHLGKKEYLLLRALVKSHLCSNVWDAANRDAHLPSWNALYAYLLSRVVPMPLVQAPTDDELRLHFKRCVDHQNVFVLVEVMCGADRSWRQRAITLYFAKVCERVLNIAQDDFDLALMQKWMRDCPDPWKVTQLRDTIATFVGQRNDENA